MQRRTLIKATAAASLAASMPNWAQTNQGKIIVGFAAGGGSDITARVLAEKLREITGITLTVENKTGAAGKISVDALKAAPADGRTLLLTPLITPVLSQIVFKNPGYDPGKDFVPIGLVANFEFCLAVGPNHPAKNLTELITWLKANPKLANFGSPSPGSLPHFFGVIFGDAIQVPMEHIAYKGGVPMVNDVMGGQVPMGIDVQGEMVELHKAGKLRILVSFAPKRTAQLPDIPTMTELGYPAATGSAWYSLWAKVGTPASEVAMWNKALNQALTLPDVKSKFHGLVQEPASSTPEELEKKRLADIAKWRPVITASGFQPQ
jgi:tripartite-type tricarboxylate transporter receptor subunit TctC